jgi:adenylate kinase family enzyme
VRIAVIGTSGAGKSTLAGALAERLGCPLLELDSIFHQANWTPLPDDEFRSRVAAFVAGEAWVVDGNYRVARPLVLARATDVVWVDPSRLVVMAQVIARSAMRVLDRKPLWNGNREQLSNWIDPGHPIRWAWSTFETRRRDYEALFASPELAEVRKHRCRTRGDISQLLATIAF